MPLVTGTSVVRSRTEAESLVVRREDVGWRSLGGAGRANDLNPSIRDRSQRLSIQMSMKNLLAKRLIRLRVNYVIGNGLSVISERPEIAIAIGRWWSDPYNNWAKRLAPRLFDLYTRGEWLHRPLIDSAGFVRIGDIDTDVIADVLMDERDHGVVDAVVIREIQDGIRTYKNKTVPVIRQRLDEDNNLDKEPSGDLFYFAINRASTQTRGSSELTSLLDYLEAFDKAFYARIDMVRALSSVYFDLEIEGMSEEGMRNYAGQNKQLPPKPGTVWTHSPTMQMKPMTPDFRSSDMEKEMKLFQSLITGSDGWPGMLFDDAGGAGRAVGSEMVDSAMRNVVALQQEIDPMLSDEIDYYLNSMGFRSRSRKEGTKMYRIVWAKPSIRETQRFAPAIERIAKTLDMAGKSRLLTRDEQRAILIQQIQQLGLTDLPMQIELPAELEEENDPPPVIAGPFGGQQQNIKPGAQQSGNSQQRALPVQDQGRRGA